ncbi:MAG: glucosaminidase domain-containing protein [Proteobacteria bacterium]|nr:glucosaminidase domain-containing protein [Pseudomonadota bacterium]
MTAEVNNSAAVYGDFASLQKLKASAHHHDPGALRQVAQQFESLFARMMIKSMRKAIGTDPIFGSDQAQTYQGMFDDQLSLELTRGKGLGLTDMLMRQLRGGYAPPAAPASPTPPSTAALPGVTAAHGAPPAAGDAERSNFVRSVWPQAQQAARELGVHPIGLVAQAALESNWGRSVPRHGNGDSSHNLFGIKAGAGWGGAAARSATHEFAGGSAVPVEAAFRSYADASGSFRDYVTLLTGSARYREALHSGGDIGAFARGLQRGGYATDPDYASKVTAVAHQVQTLLTGGRGGAGLRELKFSEARPIADGTTTL